MDDKILLSLLRKFISVKTQYNFTDIVTRDNYFTNHPSELVPDLYCVASNQLYQYKDGNWLPTTGIWRGADGSDGDDGEDGKSAYEVAVENGFVGTVTEWLDSLRGKDGSSGLVESIFGRNGTISSQSGDYNALQITETESRKFVTPQQIELWNSTEAALRTSMKLQGNWDCSTGIAPSAADTNIGVLESGCTWICSKSGTIANVEFSVGDWMVYTVNDTWAKLDNSEVVTSLNGKHGDVVIATSDVIDSLNKRYVSDIKLEVLNNTSGVNTGDETLMTILTKIGLNLNSSKRKTLVVNSFGDGITTSIPVLFLTATERTGIGTDLPCNYLIYNTTYGGFQYWDSTSSQWKNASNSLGSGGGVWGAIEGTISTQTDLIVLLNGKVGTSVGITNSGNNFGKKITLGTTDTYDVGIVCNGNELVTFTVSGNTIFSNKVCIGTTLSNAKLNVGGNISVSDGVNGYVTINPDNTPSQTGYFEWRLGNGTKLGTMGDSATNVTLTLENNAKFEVVGGTKLGSDAPAIKCKKISGTVRSSAGTTTVAHGLDLSKILNYYVIVRADSSTLLAPLLGLLTAVTYYTFNINSTNIEITVAATALNVLNKPFTVFITYEE